MIAQEHYQQALLIFTKNDDKVKIEEINKLLVSISRVRGKI